MNKMKTKIIFSLLVVGLFLASFWVSSSADAVALTVKRVIFEGSKRAEVITVINNSDKEETFRMGWRHYKMTEDRSLRAVPEDALPPEIRPSKDMIRFSPRRFTLPPRGSQQVRMLLRMPAGVEDGEYRSHLWIRPEADVQEFRAEVDKRTKPGKTGVAVRMLAGVSMPIIVRKGDLSATAEIQNLSFVKKEGFVESKFTLQYQGNRSVYGDLDFLCNVGSSNEYLIKFLRGVSIYPEVSKRNMTMKIIPRPEKPLCNNITLRYTETDGFKGDVISILSESSAAVQ